MPISTRMTTKKHFCYETKVNIIGLINPIYNKGVILLSYVPEGVFLELHARSYKKVTHKDISGGA